LFTGYKDIPQGMDDVAYLTALIDIDKKGLIKARLNHEEVVDVKLTIRGRAYRQFNPLLLNPINWSQVAALFVSCLK
jgi:hypothetical protein